MKSTYDILKGINTEITFDANILSQDELNTILGLDEVDSSEITYKLNISNYPEEIKNQFKVGYELYFRNKPTGATIFYKFEIVNIDELDDGYVEVKEVKLYENRSRTIHI